MQLVYAPGCLRNRRVAGVDRARQAGGSGRPSVRLDNNGQGRRSRLVKMNFPPLRASGKYFRPASSLGFC